MKYYFVTLSYEYLGLNDKQLGSACYEAKDFGDLVDQIAHPKMKNVKGERLYRNQLILFCKEITKEEHDKCSAIL